VLAAAQETTYDYDRTANFTQYHTYAFKEGTSSGDQLIDDRIVAALEAQLRYKGLRRVDTSPDVYVEFNMSYQKEQEATAYAYGPMYGGWGWGWGWGWGYPYYAYGYPYYGYPAYAGYGYGGYGGGYGASNWTAVKTDVSPEEAQVFLDGRFIGTADDFDGYPDYLYLQPGKYRLEFQLQGFETQSVDIDAHGGSQVKLDNHLKKIPGAKQYGSYDTPEPQGGVQRFFGKSRDQKNDIVIQPDQGNGYDNDNGHPPNDNGYGNPQNMDWRDRDNGQGSQDGPPQAPPPGKSYDDPPPPDKDRETPRQSITAAPVPSGKARLVFKVEPGDAAVYVDDRFAGTGEELSSLTRGLQIAPGMHKIVVSRPGFGPESTQVDASAGQSETVEIRLERR